jgi:hypothetical protein
VRSPNSFSLAYEDLTSRRIPTDVHGLSAPAKIALGLLFVLVGATVLTTSDALFRWALGIVESWLGREHLQRAKPRQIEDLRELIYMLGGESFLVGGLFFLGLSRTGWRRFVAAITEDPCRPGSASWRPFLLISGASLLLCLAYASMDFLKINYLYREDALFENLTVLWLFVGSVLTAGSVIRLARGPALSRSSQRRPILVALSLASSVFLGLGMEEISWGQRVFGWTAPEGLKALNYQQETNLHNLVVNTHNLYPMLSLLFVGAVLLGWLTTSVVRIPLLDYCLPHPHQLGLLNLALIVGLLPRGELLEELIALCSLCYGIRLVAVTWGAPQAADAGRSAV